MVGTIISDIKCPIFCHSFNKDKSQIAISNVKIYNVKTNDLIATLNEHDKLVTAIHWAPNSNTIVTCSQDRNAYVWNLCAQTLVWNPTLVNLRINRSATSVKWSPNERKFAVATGARVICICYFEQENNWWVAKHLKKPLKSTVLSIDWHPDNILLVAGSTDHRARVFSAFIKGLDVQSSATSSWAADKLDFGLVCGDYTSPAAGGWVHSVAFCPSGESIAFAGHDSTLCIASPHSTTVECVRLNGLPLLSILYISQNSIVGGGHDCSPFLFNKSAGAWSLITKLDQGVKKDASNGTTTGNTAMNKFRQMDSRAQTSPDSSELATIHQNTITCCQPFGPAKFTTSGIDGKIVVWDLLSAGLGTLKI